MPTPVFLTGFEHGKLITGAAPSPNDRLWHSLAGAPSISTTTIKSGARSLQCQTAADTEYVGRNLAGSPNVLVGSFYVRFATLPGANVNLFAALSAGSFAFIRFNSTSGKLEVLGGASSPAAFGPVLSVDTWYLVDFRFTVSANPWVLIARVDGANENTSQPALAATTFTSWRMGLGTDNDTSTADAFYDDLVLTQTSGDYPLGSHEVLKMSPNADGTHSFTANDFIRGDAGAAILTSDTDVWTLVDDVPFGTIGTTDSVQQNVIRTTGYVEIALEAAPRTVDAWGIQISLQLDADGTGADNVKWQENDGGTTREAYNGDVSNTSETLVSTCHATAPSTGAYTQTKLNALMIRWGFSSDVTGSPIVHALMVEVAYPAATVVELDAQPGSYALTGVVAGLVGNIVLAATAGSYSLVGTAATVGIEQSAAPGSYTLTGAVADMVAQYTLVAAPGTYSLAGIAATWALEFPASVGAYVLTGFMAELEHIIPSGAFVIDAQPGAYAVTGSAAALVAQYAVGASSGSYTISGVLATIALEFPAMPGDYLLVGAVADLQFITTAFSIDAAPGAYSLVGVPDGASLIERVTGTARYEVLQGDGRGIRRTIIVTSGGRSRDV